VYFLGQFVGRLIITFLLSRVGLFLLRGWDGGAHKLAVVHGGTLAFCWTMYDLIIGRGWSSGFVFLIPVIIWFVVDLVRSKGDIDPEQQGA
jgi:hypothetical protein